MLNEVFAYKNQGQLNANLVELKALLKQQGVDAVDSAPFSIEKFAALDSPCQQKILNNISTYLHILSQGISPATERSIRQVEISRLKNAMQAFRLRALDKSVFELIQDDDIVEIYSEEGIQLYRNVLFCKMCSYSLLDLAVNSWEHLYEKPAKVTNDILSHIQSVLNDSEGTIPYKIETFVQREKFIYAKTLRTYLVTPRFLSPLIDEQSGRRIAMLSTYGARVIAEGDDSLKFDII